MALSVVITLFFALSVLFSLLGGTGAQTAAAVFEGAAAGVQLALSLAGSICLWTGLCRVMEASGLSRALARLLRPLLGRLFPEAARNEKLFSPLCANFTANLLGLGNAATPMGMETVRQMRAVSGSDTATDEMCRFVVLNTASIQLIPATVAAVRAGAGAQAPLDILPCVLLTSLLSVTAGEGAALLFGRWCRR